MISALEVAVLPRLKLKRQPYYTSWLVTSLPDTVPGLELADCELRFAIFFYYFAEQFFLVFMKFTTQFLLTQHSFTFVLKYFLIQ